LTQVTPLALDPDAACLQRDPRTLAKPWAALAAQRQDPTVFLTPEWHEVVRANTAASELTLTVSEPICGIAALAREADGTLRFAGGDLTDIQDLLAVPGAEAEVARALGRWLVAAAPPSIELSNVPEESPTFDEIAPLLSAAGYEVERRRLVTAPRMTLPGDFETYVASLGKKERHELRRKIRRLQGSAEASFRTATETERPAVLERFFELHRLSRGHKADFMTPPVERFFRDVADAMAPLDRLRLGVLRVDGVDVAVLFAFAYRGVLELYNAAYDPGLSSLSIGIVSHAWAIREAIADGIRVYDMLRGDEPYKYDLGAQDRYLTQLTARPRAS
jgi:CelD/BcsL family acetyltransferase involved in cellulose biosynthesis